MRYPPTLTLSLPEVGGGRAKTPNMIAGVFELVNNLLGGKKKRKTQKFARWPGLLFLLCYGFYVYAIHNSGEMIFPERCVALVYFSSLASFFIILFAPRVFFLSCDRGSYRI